jgi:membrane protease YdiL (CAAX protease family)
MFLFFVSSIYAYVKESDSLNVKAFSERYRLSRIPRPDWIWVLLVLVVQTGFYFGLGFTAEYLAEIPFFSPHPVFAPEFGPGGVNAHVPGELMGMQLHGQWWIVFVFFLGWVFNVFGEEFWFRGYLLPRQEKAFGRFAWVVNGLMFGFNHIWQPWNLLMIVPGALVGSFIVQKRKNTWVLLIPHGILNVSLLFVIFFNVIGIKV